MGRQVDGVPLTARRLEVLELLAQGLTTSEIGRRLFLEPSTVKTHIKFIYRAIGARNRVQATAWWRDHYVAPPTRAYVEVPTGLWRQVVDAVADGGTRLPVPVCARVREFEARRINQ
jgi:DNA-binding CsgD family transcriptional regulator